MRYRTKPVEIEAITFKELVVYGKENGGNIVDGMPWSFKYKEAPVTHENNECYIVCTTRGSQNMTPNDMLIVDGKDLYICNVEDFNKAYDKV